jgi:hypothetical protein
MCSAVGAARLSEFLLFKRKYGGPFDDVDILYVKRIHLVSFSYLDIIGRYTISK